MEIVKQNKESGYKPLSWLVKLSLLLLKEMKKKIVKVKNLQNLRLLIKRLIFLSEMGKTVETFLMAIPGKKLYCEVQDKLKSVL